MSLASRLALATPQPARGTPFNLLPKEDTPPPPPVKNDEETPWPAQFGSKWYNKAGFIYKSPTNISDFHTMSKKSIICACRDYGIHGYGIWSREPLKMFTRWFLNEVAGNLSLLSGGLQKMGYGEDLAGKAREWKRAWMRERLERRMRRAGRRSRRVVERDTRERRSFGEKGLGAGKRRGCAKRGCGLEFKHEEAHLIM
jgi:hypothetical protein